MPLTTRLLLLSAFLLFGSNAFAQKKPTKRPAKPPTKPAPKVTATEPPATSSITLTNLRCEYLVNPLAVETNAPRLSWEPQSEQRGARQTAYQIVVASSFANLNTNKGDLWDTGKVASNQTIHVEYRGRQLLSRQQAFWKVRVWDQAGKASAWSQSSPQSAHWTQGMSNWSAQWIGDSAPSKENVAATMLRREFKITPRAKAVIKRAILYASALGVYELRLNGQRVGDAILAPEFTDYHQRTQYQAYDVTALLKVGDNAIGALLGDGWYAGGLGVAEILIQQPRNVYGSHPRLMAQLDIEMSNGDEERVISDSQWKATREGPIRSSDILMGEVYDARREMPGWDKAGFDDKTWTKADALAMVTTKLYAQVNEPIRITRAVKPIAVNEPKAGVYVFDLGQNMAGWVRMQMQGAAGATVKLTHAEMLNADGTVYTENLRSARQTDEYTLKASPPNQVETFEPHFTYHGFRYVQVTGLAKKPQLSDLIGQQFNSDMRETSSFETSSPLLNQLWQNILWTQRDNMLSIPTDCPQRDERMGWLGDIQAFAGTGIYNMDMAAFLTKWLRDVRDAQTPDGRFPDFAPHPFQKTLEAMKKGDFMGAPGWGDAGVVVPWRAWQHYGDQRLLAENYESSKRWIEFIRKNNPDLLWKLKRGNDYGDWLNADTMKHSSIPTKGGEVPKDLFATMMFAHATELVGKMATVLNKPDDAAQYNKLFNDIKAAFNKAYVAADGKLTGNTQAGYALALHFNLLPDSKRAAALKFMLDGIKAYKGHMSTGFHSTYRMMLELTRAGQNDTAYQLINQTSFPSWGYSIEQGATTIWERWDAYVKGRGFQDKGMNSFNHYAIGAVGEWMMRTIVGINHDDEKPAYEHFVIRPQPGGGLTHAKGAYHSIRGKIESAWRSENGKLTLEVTIPANTTATVYVPAKDAESVTESGKAASQAEGVRFVKMENGAAMFEVAAGRYRFAAN